MTETDKWIEKFRRRVQALRFTDGQARLLVESILSRSDSVYHSDEAMLKRLAQWRHGWTELNDLGIKALKAKKKRGSK